MRLPSCLLGKIAKERYPIDQFFGDVWILDRFFPDAAYFYKSDGCMGRGRSSGYEPRNAGGGNDEEDDEPLCPPDRGEIAIQAELLIELTLGIVHRLD